MELLFILIVRLIIDVETSTRPLLKEGPQKLFDLKKQRHQLYLDACDVHLMNNDTIENIIDKIIELINK